MAVNNELLYNIRFDTEGQPQLVKATDTLTKTDQVAGKAGKSMGGLSNQTGKAAKNAVNLQKRNSVANIALLDFTRIAQDAQFGIRGVANNLEQSAASFSHLRGQTGSTTGALKSMIGQIAGPLGLVVGVTVLTQVLLAAENGLFSFGSEVEDNTERLKRFSEAASSQLGGFLSDLTDEQKVEVLNSAIDSILRVDEIERSIKQGDDALQNLVNNFDSAAMVAGEFNAAVSDRAIPAAQQQINEEINRNIQRQSELNDAVLEELNNRLAIAEANRLIRQELERIGIINESLAGQVEEQLSDLPVPDIDTPFFGEGEGKDKLEQQLADDVAARAQAANQEVQIALDTARKIERIEREKAQSKIQFQQLAAQASGDILTAFFGKSKDVAMAMALVDTFQAAQRAYASQLIPGDPSSPARAAVAAAIATAAGLARVESIRQTDIDSGSGASQGSTASFRGFSASPMESATVQSRPRQVRQERDITFPRTLRLEDKAGNFLTKLQFAQDKAGGRPYLSEQEG